MISSFTYDIVCVCVFESYGGGERCVQDFGGETWGKETTGENQAQMGGQY